MHDREHPAFEEKITEMAQALRTPVPLSPGLVKHLWLAARGFDLATFRQGCDDLVGTLDFFPKPAELRRACEVYGRTRLDDQRPFRCMHIDYTRAALPDDVDERHWRCPAIFEYEAGQIYCPSHRKLYHSESHAAAPEQISEAFSEALAVHPGSGFMREQVAERAERLGKGEYAVSAALHALLGAIGKTMPDAHDSAEVIRARKEDQRRRAIEAGLLQREPGYEG